MFLYLALAVAPTFSSAQWLVEIGSALVSTLWQPPGIFSEPHAWTVLPKIPLVSLESLVAPAHGQFPRAPQKAVSQ